MFIGMITKDPHTDLWEIICVVYFGSMRGNIFCCKLSNTFLKLHHAIKPSNHYKHDMAQLFRS